MAVIPLASSVFDTPSVLFGVLGLLALVLTLSLTAFVWVCCQRSAPAQRRPGSCGRARTPYRFVHMLKSAHIYPDTLGGRRHPLAPKQRPREDSPRRGPGAPEAADETASAEKRGGGSCPADLGTLAFSLRRDEARDALLVHVKDARGLPPPPPRAGSDGDDRPAGPADSGPDIGDTRVKLVILPERRYRAQTRLLRATRDPVFDETFAFYGLSAAQMEGAEVSLAVLSFGRFSRREEVVGEVTAPLAGVADAAPAEVEVLRRIVPRDAQKSAGLGEMLVSLSFAQDDSRLAVAIVKARGLHKRDSNPSLDTCVKVTAFAGTEHLFTGKARGRRASTVAVFNQSFEVALGGGGGDPELVLLLHAAGDTVEQEEENRAAEPGGEAGGSGLPLLGRVVLGAGVVSPRARQHWQEARAGAGGEEEAGKPIARWHALQPC